MHIFYTHVQIRLVQDDILIRGAILVGKAERSYRQHFGPAVIAACDLKRKEMFPRIVVDHSLLEELKNPAVGVHPDVDEIFASSLIRRENGAAFIDYLRVAAEQLSRHYPNFVRKHRQVIDAGIRDAKDEGVREKYVWLDEYHERTIAHLDDRNDDDSPEGKGLDVLTRAQQRHLPFQSTRRHAAGAAAVVHPG